MWNAMRYRFTCSWENARLAQQQRKCAAAENRLRSAIDETQRRIDYEIRCKYEVEEFMTKTIDAMNAKCVEWMERFDNDYETAEVDIQVTIEQHDELRRKRDEALAESERRQHVIDEFYRKRREREDFARRELAYTKVALVLQIWWRSFLVRYGVAPYAFKKAKKGGKKKKR